jgi:hypothetical protein
MQQVGHLLDALEDLAHRVARRAGDAGAGRDGERRFADQVLDFLRGRCGMKSST